MSKGTMLTIGRQEATQALSDEKFLSSFPMFKTIRSKSDMLKKSSAAGCSSCRQRRIASNLTLDFLNVLKTLPVSEVAKIKQYFGYDKMMYTRFDAEKGVYRTEVV